jgi:branched-chain amino acid transport system permease protein
MELTAIWDLFVTGILRGGMYALMAVGLSLVFGVMNIPNFAHGEFYMLGAYVAYIVHRTWDLPSLLATIMPLSLASVVAPVLAILAAGLFGFVLGLLVEKGVFYPLRIKAKEGWIINTFLLTVGLSFVVQNVALSIWGAKHRGIPGYWKGSLNLGGRMNIPTDRLVAFLLAVLIIGVFWFFMRRTRTGRAIRAVSQDERAQNW